MKPDRSAQASIPPPPGAATAYPDFNLEALFATSNQVVSDAVIEQFVRDPGSLPPGIRSVVEELLEEDCGVQLMEAFYRSFYEELDRLPSRSPSNVEAFIISIFPSPNVVPLFPLEPQVKPSGSPMSRLIPATMSSGARMLLRPILLLGSAEAQVVVYLLRDWQVTEFCRTYVLMSDRSKRANVVITFPDLDIDIFVRNGSADFLLPNLESNQDLLASAILRLPVLEVKCAKNRFTSPQLQAPTGDSFSLPTGHRLEIQDASGSFRLVLDAGDADDPTLIRRVVVKTDEGSAYIMRVAGGHGELTIEGSLERGWIGLYE